MLSDGDKRCTCGAGHVTFGECLRAKNLKIAYCGIGGGDFSRQRKWDAELHAYESACKEGIQPAGTTLPQIERARKLSDREGAAFDASAAGRIGDNWTDRLIERKA